MSIKVFDFFSGCGGTSCGFESAGFDIAFALDSDPVAIATFQENFPRAHTQVASIQDVHPRILTPIVGERIEPILFCGCAPCQPFSKQNKNKKSDDPRRSLLLDFSKFVEHWLPEYVVVENVPGMQKLKLLGPFDQFRTFLEKLGYKTAYDVIPACGFGVPQKRERLVLIASIISDISLPEFSHDPSKGIAYSTVRDWISNLPTLAAGEVCEIDPDHQAARLSETNIKRIKATPEGGSRDSWPEYLWLNCHKEHSGHTDVYGRLHWDRPASGLTTRCISLSNGRFGHPTQDRAISVREAACLQTFPRNYKFKGSLQSKARQIGNAVPPLMAQRVGEAIYSHFLASKTEHDSLGKITSP
uniref:DNA cytosine methyltransferase n=1 Tax=Marinobacterium profundum TaxID=1714300 RepID=UPI0009E73DFC|nr:DNA cytosine methyltransferase [Marinobacterium profundum]